VRPEGLGTLKKFFHLIGSQIHDLTASSVVPQKLRYRVPQTVQESEIDSSMSH
jgi:hypothetical protein